MAAQSPQPGDKKPQLNRGFWILWLVGLVLLTLWNVVALPHATTEVTLPYSTLLAQVQAGNVSSVHLTGDQIEGTFAHPYTPPEPQASPGAQGSSHQPPPRYTSFTSTFPQAVGDPRFLPLLSSHHVTVDVSTPTQNWLLTLFLTWGPLTAALRGLLYLSARASQNMRGGMFGFGRAKAHRYTSDQPKVTFDDVAGADEAKSELQEEVDFCATRTNTTPSGPRSPRGAAGRAAGHGQDAAGARGRGRSAACRSSASARRSSSRCSSASAPAACAISSSRPRTAAPAIVFIDELDAVGRRRGAGVGDTSTTSASRRSTSCWASWTASIRATASSCSRRRTAPTCSIRRCCARAASTGRSPSPLPDWRGREGILRIHTRQLQLAPDVDLELLAGHDDRA